MSSWDTFPAGYRKRKVAQIAAWIDAGESGLVVGLSGAGKSNVLGFVAHRLTGHGSPLRPLLDLNRLPEPTLSAFFRQLLAALNDAAAQQLPPDALERLRTITEKGLTQADAFLLGRSVESALNLLCGEMKLRMVILMDRFDVALERFDAPFYNNLRAWRDAHKARLTYVVAARRDWPDWPNLPALSEFTDLIAGRTCWVGALSTDDCAGTSNALQGKNPTRNWSSGWLNFPAVTRDCSEPCGQLFLPLTGREPAWGLILHRACGPGKVACGDSARNYGVICPGRFKNRCARGRWTQARHRAQPRHF